MSITAIRGKQVLDGTIQRVDLDTTTAGLAVVAKIVGGTNVTLASTGIDSGTGDVTITVPNVQFGGQLQYVSATALSFKPFNGAQIRINGVIYTIPSGGISGLANTSVYVNGTAAQNLAASTLYLVYCFNNAGTLTADFSTTAHATSATAGNAGNEIKSGDDSRTFIGLIYTNASSQFADASTTRFVRSWVNRKRISFSNSVSGGPTGSTTDVALITSNCLSFADETVNMASSGAVYNTTAGQAFWISNYIDGAVVGAVAIAGCNPASTYFPVGLNWVQPTATEANHTLATYGRVGGGSGYYTIQVSGTIGL